MNFKDKTWIIISFLVVLIALIWLGITVRNTLTKPTLPEDLERLEAPLSPNINEEVFEKLRQRNGQ